MNRTSDVIVIGAGIIGCAIARELARRGARVLVVEMRNVGLGATQASAGMLAPYIEGYDVRPLRELGVRSLALYDSFVSAVTEETGMPVEYEWPGSLQVVTGDDRLAALEARGADLMRLGVGAEFLDGPRLREAEPDLAQDVLGGLLVPGHAYVGAAALTRALFKAASDRQARIQEERALKVSSGAGGVRVLTSSATLIAKTAVLAAGSWSGRIEIDGVAPLPVRPVRGQIVQLDWPGRPLSRIIWAPDCYLVPWKDETLLVGATEEEAGFDERPTAAGVRDLLDAACNVIPRGWQATFAGVRVGLRPATPDGLPIVGPSRRVPGLIYATGHHRNGVLLAPLTTKLVADLILEDREDPALRALSPDRFGEY